MSGEVSKKLAPVKIPKMFPIRQVFSADHIAPTEIHDIVQSILMQNKFSSKIKPGMEIAITAGSRGIANISIIAKEIVDFVKSRGGCPFIVPAMGSHGGATAEGQKSILAGLGITESFCGCEIRSSMETVHIGVTSRGKNVYIDKNAAEADGIIVLCRIKPHTAFRGPYESGIMKMMTIGLGKQYGAEQCHNEGFGLMAVNIPDFGKTIIENAPILFSVAVLENAYDQTRKIVAVDACDIEKEEPPLLQEAFTYMPRILVDSCDVLIVDQVGKNFTGGGMDPNITGTWITPYGGGGIKSERVAVLDVSAESHGNAHGVGNGDVTTRRLLDKCDFDAMYMNGLTGNVLGPSKIPYVMDNDKEAIQLCILTCTQADKQNPRIVRIPNSLQIEHIWLSEAYYEEAKQNPQIIIEDEPREMAFDENGNLF